MLTSDLIPRNNVNWTRLLSTHLVETLYIRWKIVSKSNLVLSVGEPRLLYQSSLCLAFHSLLCSLCEFFLAEMLSSSLRSRCLRLFHSVPDSSQSFPSLPFQEFSRDLTAAMLVSPINPLNFILMETFCFVLVGKHAHWSPEWKRSIDLSSVLHAPSITTPDKTARTQRVASVSLLVCHAMTNNQLHNGRMLSPNLSSRMLFDNIKV